ncbi:ABC transporter family substrate-binding protein [Cellulomonas bogoriensis]|uniref:ABC transporter family substrate-binding protein n=1 Tax=Cellulomonas bogoriensis TaxID=301388 RepID=UPI000A9F7CD6|nr:ABC transporter family substrate-binding protein [Cellulomonas bogoriensis]
MAIGWNQAFYSQNNLTSTGNAAANANILYLTNTQLFYYDEGLNVVRNEDLGTYEVIEEDPFTVQYTINEGPTWSDGAPLDAYDVFLYWAAQNDQWDNVAPEYDDEGNLINEEEVEAGVFFDSSSPGANAISQIPEISDDGQTVTFVYDQPRSDWEVVLQPSPVAAHALVDVALGEDDPAVAKQRLYDAFANNVSEDLGPISRAWNDDFNFSSLPEDERLYLSSGAYVMTAFEEGQYLTVNARDDYDWGPEARIESVTVRYSEDPLAAATALQNGEVDMISPQASVDLVATLEGIDGIQFQGTAEGTYEHVDVIFDNNGPFDAASYDGDEETARLVRQAFLLSVPRAEIMEKLVRPIQEDAVVRNSHNAVPGAPNYDELTENNGSDMFSEDDEENRQRAIELLEEAGVDTPVDVRFLYGQGNVRRENQFELISVSASQVGFNLIDEGDVMWGARLAQTTTYDASLFGWQSTNTFALNSQANYVTGGVNNFGGYSDEQMDAWWDELAVNTDPEVETELLIQIERQLFEDGFSIPIFQHPGVMAWRDEFAGASTIPLSPTIFWNFWEWDIDPEDSIEITEEPLDEADTEEE